MKTDCQEPPDALHPASASLPGLPLPHQDLALLKPAHRPAGEKSLPSLARQQGCPETGRYVQMACPRGDRPRIPTLLYELQRRDQSLASRSPCPVPYALLTCRNAICRLEWWLPVSPYCRITRPGSP